MFDTSNFLNKTYNEKTSTELINVPEGDWPAVVTDLKPRAAQTKDGERPMLDVIFTITDQSVLDVVKRDKATVRKSCWLDLTPEGNLDMSEGKNTDLGKLREVWGQNKAGASWSPMDFKGQAALIKVTHAISGDKIFVNVAEVAAL